MLMNGVYILKLVLLLKVLNCNAEDTYFTINGKKSLNTVSEKFISFTIDPAVLLTDLNISATSMNLARHLQPAYLRIGGPSTQFVEYVENDTIISAADDDNQTLLISKPMWAAINSWINDTNLTPIFSINDNNRLNGTWNSKSLYHLFETSEKLNISTYWQLGYDCSNKTENEYKEDLLALYQIFQSFPDKKDSWKIIGSDISRCFRAANFKDINNLENVTTAIMWEPITSNIYQFPENKWQDKPFSFDKYRIPFWTTAPKSPNPITFADALLWGKQIGDVATSGYEVIFRQPRARELYTETSVYWISLIHKNLMGRNVLEIKPTVNINKDISVYAHCTKKQSSFSKSGAMTIFIVNNGTSEHTASIKMPLSNKKSIEVQSYIITSPNENSTDTFLNGKKLSVDDLENEEMLLIPKIRRARTMTHLTLSLPRKSAGFFVIPSARIPICINTECEMDILIDEILDDQNINFSGETSTQVQSRFSENGKDSALNELYNMMGKELQAGETYYRNIEQKNQNGNKDWKKILLNRVREGTLKKPIKDEVLDKKQEDLRQKIIDNAKTIDKHKTFIENSQKKVDFKHLLLGRNKEFEKKKELKKTLIDELTSNEVETILRNRQKDKDNDKYKLTSAELDEIFSILSKNFKKSNKHKRAINMDLLNLQTKDFSQEDVSLNNKFKEFQMASAPVKNKTKNTESKKVLASLKPLLPSKSVKTTSTTTTKPKKDVTGSSELKTALDSFESIEDDLDDHSFYEKLGFTVIQSKPTVKELFEADLNNNKLDDDEFALEDDIQAYLAKNKPEFYKNSKDNQKNLDQYFTNPKNAEQSDESFNSFYDDLNEELHRTKRSILPKRRVVRQSLKEKLNLFHENSISSILHKKPLLKYYDNDDYLKPNKKEGIIKDIKDRSEARREKLKEMHEELLEKIEDIKSKIRVPRSTSNDISQHGELNKIFYEYKPLIGNIKKWKPEDVVLEGEYRQKKKLFAMKQLREALKQQKRIRIGRSVSENDIDSNENQIDYDPYDNMLKNKLTKDSSKNSIKSLTADKNQNNAILNKTENDIIKETKQQVENTSLKNVEIITFNEDQIFNTTLYSYTDKNSSLTPKYGTTREHIQKINVNFKPNFIQQIFERFGEFFIDMQKKLSGYFYM